MPGPAWRAPVLRLVVQLRRVAGDDDAVNPYELVFAAEPRIPPQVHRGSARRRVRRGSAALGAALVNLLEIAPPESEFDAVRSFERDHR
jgi:hypothetical protein